MFSLFSFLFSTLIVEHMNIKGIFCVNNIVHILEYGNVMMQYTWLAIIILSHCHCDNMNIDEHSLPTTPPPPPPQKKKKKKKENPNIKKGLNFCRELVYCMYAINKSNFIFHYIK